MGSKIRHLSDNRIYASVTKWLFPLVIVLFSFIKVNRGIDITDSAYSCTNFTILDSLDGMWFFSTFYANLLGALFTKLPGGTTLFGLNIYTGLIKTALALAAYFFFKNKVKISGELSFLAAIVSLGLCWCPTTILYNYLSYLLFFAGAAVLYQAICKDSYRLYILAGFILGSNVFVRLPNVTEALLIVAVWFNAAIRRKEFKKCLQETLFCIMGYALAVVPALTGVIATRGVSAYIKGIMELFAMTEDAEGYSSLGMIAQLVKSYLVIWKYLAILLITGVLSWLAFKLKPEKIKPVKYLTVALMTFLFLFYSYRNGIFSRDYHTYGAIFGIGKYVLFIGYIVLIQTAFDKKNSVEDRVLSIMAVVIMLITPLGTNNEVYANLNNMFFVLPVLVKRVGTNEKDSSQLDGVRFEILLILLAFSFQSICFGSTFVFRDGQNEAMDTRVENNTVLSGMLTTADNAARLSEASSFWKDNSLADGTVLLYGNVCGLGFYLDTEVAIETAWPSLQSYSASKFETAIDELEGKLDSGSKKPSVIIGISEYDGIYSSDPDIKQEILKNFLEKYNYEVKYDNTQFVVLLSE